MNMTDVFVLPMIAKDVDLHDSRPHDGIGADYMGILFTVNNDSEGQTRATHIAHAVNYHDELVGALRWIATEEFDCMPGHAVQELLRDFIGDVLAAEDTP